MFTINWKIVDEESVYSVVATHHTHCPANKILEADPSFSQLPHDPLKSKNSKNYLPNWQEPTIVIGLTQMICYAFFKSPRLLFLYLVST